MGRMALTVSALKDLQTDMEKPTHVAGPSLQTFQVGSYVLERHVKSSNSKKLNPRRNPEVRITEGLCRDVTCGN